MTQPTNIDDIDCPVAPQLAARLRDERQALTDAWLERMRQPSDDAPRSTPPGDDLKEHVPLLIEGIADHLENPQAPVGGQSHVAAKASALGKLRHAQGADVYEILKEYEVLGQVLFAFLATIADEIPEQCTKAELLVCGHRLFSSVAIMQQTTTNQYLELATARVKEREERLLAFNRTVAHELKNQIGAILGASATLRDVNDLLPEQRTKFTDMISGNALAMRDTIDNLTVLSRLDRDALEKHCGALRDAIGEAVERLAERAKARNVSIRVPHDIPDVDVNAPAVGLALNNLVLNAIKYADPNKQDRWVEISSYREPAANDTPECVVVKVRDNGIGVPPDKRDGLFQRFFRAHEGQHVPGGTGLGLSIVRESVEALGGKAWAEFPDEGSVFAFSLPLASSMAPPSPVDRERSRQERQGQR